MALIPPKIGKRARSRSNNRHLPSELIEEILLNVPQKSLARFSAVSKSWKSMIFEPVFARKHINRAALLRRHSLVVYMNADMDEAASFFSLAPISSDLRFKVIMKPHNLLDGHGMRTSVPSFSVFCDTNIDARDFVGQFEGKPYLRACCDELWCVELEVEKSLFLWNPSMRNIVQLPRPLIKSRPNYDYHRYFMYGLAYDSVNDDYKILKIRRHLPCRTELYSHKNNCWKKIKPLYDAQPSFNQQQCEFVDGRFHWIGFTAAKEPTIVLFDLSTEKYEVVAQPWHDAEINFEGYGENYFVVVALRGKLSASLNCTGGNGRFVLWVMDEYGIEKSWTKTFDFELYTNSISIDIYRVIPLYLSDNNDLLVKMYEIYKDYMYIYMYRNGEAKPNKIVTCGDRSLYYQADAFLYVESLITHNNFSKNIDSSAN